MDSILKWSARILAVIYSLLIGSFSVVSFGNWFIFFVSLIPTSLIIIMTIIAWKNELKGGIGFSALGFIFMVLFSTLKSWEAFFTLSAPLFFIGGLFLLKSKLF